MENIKIVESESFGIITEHVIIDRGNGEFTSMPKEEYDRQQAQQVEHLTEIVADETKAK